MSDQLQMFGEQTFPELTSSLLEVLAKISHWQENDLGWKEKEVLLSSKQSDYIQRCMEAIGSEYPDKDQAVAVCYTQWREGK